MAYNKKYPQLEDFILDFDKGQEDRIGSEFDNIGTGVVMADLDFDGGIRFANGFQISWIRKDAETLGGTYWDTSTKIWYSNHNMGNWKYPFTTIITAFPTVREASFWASATNWTTTNAGTVRVYRPNDGTSTAPLIIMAIGRWK